MSCISKHIKDSIIPCYENSLISSEAKIITDEVLTIYKKKSDKIKNTILALQPSEISILLKTLSNHNSLLNYHLEKLNSYTIHSEYCTDLLKGNSNWELECLERASHILLDCTQFIELRVSIIYKPKLTPNDLSNYQ